MKKIYKVFTVILVIVISAIVISALYTFFAPVKNIAAQKTDFEIKDVRLFKDFTDSAQEADTKYKNKILLLCGVIKKTEISDSTCTIIFDKGGNFIITANCIQQERNKIAVFKKGDTVTIKGIYSGYIINDETFMIPAEIKIDKCTFQK